MTTVNQIVQRQLTGRESQNVIWNDRCPFMALFRHLSMKVSLKIQLDVFYLFICWLYMFRATPIFRSFKCTLQTIGVCTSFDVLLHWIGYWLGHPRTSVTVRFKIHLVGISIKPLLPRCMEPRISKVSHVGCI